MQSHGRLAGTGPTLHDEQSIERAPDDLVLLGLDGGDDVEHLAGPCPFQLGEQRVAASKPRPVGVLVARPEQIVSDSDDLGAIHHDLAPPLQPKGVPGACTVEGGRYRCAPVDYQNITLQVFDMEPPDSPALSTNLVDPAEKERSPALTEQSYAPQECFLVVEVRFAGSP